MVAQLGPLFSTTGHKVKTQGIIPSSGQKRGDIDIINYLLDSATVHMPHTASVVNHQSHKLTLFPIGFRGYHHRASTVLAGYPTSDCNLVPHLLGVLAAPAHWSKRGYKSTLFNLVKFAKQTSLVSSCPRNPLCTLDHPTVCR
jgi:hypothetical protein